MPKMDGYESTSQIRNHIDSLEKEQPYIVAISGHVEDHYRERALEAGMNSIIPKPAKLKDLKLVIAQLSFK